LRVIFHDSGVVLFKCAASLLRFDDTKVILYYYPPNFSQIIFQKDQKKIPPRGLHGSGIHQ